MGQEAQTALCPEPLTTHCLSSISHKCSLRKSLHPFLSDLQHALSRPRYIPFTWILSECQSLVFLISCPEVTQRPERSCFVICAFPSNLGKSDNLRELSWACRVLSEPRGDWQSSMRLAVALAGKVGVLPAFFLWEVSAAVQTTNKAALSARARLYLVAVCFEWLAWASLRARTVWESPGVGCPRGPVSSKGQAAVVTGTLCISGVLMDRSGPDHSSPDHSRLEHCTAFPGRGNGPSITIITYSRKQLFNHTLISSRPDHNDHPNNSVCFPPKRT